MNTLRSLVVETRLTIQKPENWAEDLIRCREALFDDGDGVSWDLVRYYEMCGIDFEPPFCWEISCI